jgi:NADH:ubiquinone reductase (H+-translocating)
MPNVVIVGGGFGGLFAARALRQTPVSVTLVDRAPHHLFQPLLYQCATVILSEGQIAAPLRHVLKRHDNVDCVLAEAVDIDVEARRLIGVREGGERVELPYDYLILAAGVEGSYFGNDKFAQYAPGMKTLSDALAIRQKVFGAFERAEIVEDPDERRRWLTFALVGAGPTGVELAGQIREMATHTLRSEFRKVDPAEARVLLFDGGDAPLAAFGPALAAKAARSLTRLGVELHMHSKVTDIDGDGLTVLDESGESKAYRAGTVLWTAGVAAPALSNALAARIDVERDHVGRIVVGHDLTVPGHPEIAVIGDLMSYKGLPGLAEVAMQSGYFAGRRIHRRVSGDLSVHEFRYRDLGSAAYISRGDAVVAMGPVHYSGLAGWVTWLFIHIAFLTGYRNRFGAILTWWVAFTWDRRRERAFLTVQLENDPSTYAAGPGQERQGDEH